MMDFEESLIRQVSIYVDGFMRTGSPCYAGGCSVVHEDGTLLYRRYFETRPPRKWTNNDAELWAVAMGVHLAAPGETVYSDSEVVVKWWLPRRTCKSRPDLTPLCRHAAQEADYKGIDVRWVPRERNLAGIYNEKHRAELFSNYDHRMASSTTT